MTVAAPQLSVAVAANVTTVLQEPASAELTMAEGQAIEGACVSFTVTVNEQVEVLPAASVAVAVTVVTPTLNIEPEGEL